MTTPPFIGLGVSIALLFATGALAAPPEGPPADSEAPRANPDAPPADPEAPPADGAAPAAPPAYQGDNPGWNLEALGDEASPPAAGAERGWMQEVDVELGGAFRTNLWFQLHSNRLPSYSAETGAPTSLESPTGVARSENILNLELDAFAGDFRAVADVDFVLTGFPRDVGGLEDLQLGERLHPFRFEARSLYIEARDLLWGGFDLRIGQQLVLWGQGDQFNPTNTLNADDLEDVLRFGEQQGNFMVRLDQSFSPTWSVTAVLVPLFKPAMLPASAPIGVAAIDRLPMLDDGLRYRFHTNLAVSREAGFPTVVTQTRLALPDAGLGDMQLALRVGGALGGQDVALSYYYGRNDFPVPIANHTQQAAPVCADEAESGDLLEAPIRSAVTLGYPRMHVVGLNMAGEIGPFGYRLEAGLFFPERARITITNDDIVVWAPLVAGQPDSPIPIPSGEYDYGLDGGERPLVLGDTPFAKWVLGLDTSLGEHVYLNVQWVHGLVDEFGAGDFITEGYTVRAGGVNTPLLGNPGAGQPYTLGCRVGAIDAAECAVETRRSTLGDYLVIGADFKARGGDLLARLFMIWDLTGVRIERWDAARGERVVETRSTFTEDGFSLVVFPELAYQLGHGLELAAGALVQLGKPHSKFGDPAAGGTLAWTRASYSF